MFNIGLKQRDRALIAKLLMSLSNVVLALDGITENKKVIITITMEDKEITNVKYPHPNE